MKIRICAALLALFALAFPLRAGNSSEGFDYSSVLRLHIVANSDSAFDQDAKLFVRDALLSAEKESMAGAGDKSAARTALMSSGGDVLRTVNEALEAYGADYGARLALGNYEFPYREYSGAAYPAGRYDALKVVLGDGGGKNWWCVMFPPLCILELDDGNIESCELHMDSLIVKLLKSIDGGKLWEQIKAGLR